MCETEQLESFKRHMEAGEMSVQAGEDENEEDIENGQLLHNTAANYSINQTPQSDFAL